MKDKFKFFKREEEGFILAFAMIIVATLLVIAISVSQIISQELSFTRLVYNNHNAYFAADSGLECAEYVDNVFRDQSKGVSLFLNSLTGGLAETNFYTNASQNVFFASSSLSSDYPSIDISGVSCNSDNPDYNYIFRSTSNKYDSGYVATQDQVIANLAKGVSSFTVTGNTTEATTTFGFIVKSVNEDNKEEDFCVLVDFVKVKNPANDLTQSFVITSTGYSDCNPNDKDRVLRTIYHYSTF